MPAAVRRLAWRFLTENSAKVLARRQQLSAQHRRWNPRRNFRFRRGTAALAEPKDDRSANEIARDNSLPRGSLLLRFSSCISLNAQVLLIDLRYMLRSALLRSPCSFLRRSPSPPPHPPPPPLFLRRSEVETHLAAIRLYSSIDCAAHDECVVRSKKSRTSDARFIARLDAFSFKISRLAFLLAIGEHFSTVQVSR